MTARSFFLAALSGVAVAVVSAYLAFFVLLAILFTAPSLRPEHVLPAMFQAPVARVLRSLPYLLFAGALAGVLRLRAFRLLPARRRPVRVLSTGGLCLLLAVAAGIAVHLLYLVHFWLTIGRHQFTPGTSEGIVRARLGTPSAGSHELLLPFCQCTNGHGTKALGYSSRPGGEIRLLCFDASARFLCDAYVRVH